MADNDKGEEQGTKFSKESEDSLWNGPVKKRCCTDIICIPIFILHIIAFWALTFMNAGAGDPMKLIKPRDFKGDYCGIASSGQWEGGGKPNMVDFTKKMWSMNLDETFTPVVKDMVCGSLGYSVLVSPGLASTGTGVGPTSANKISAADYNAYCGKAGSAMADAAAAASDLKNQVSGTIAQFSDPTQAYKLFTGGSKVGGSFLKEVTKYFKMVCTKTCDMGSNMTAPRKYTYMPAPNLVWGTDKTKPALGIWSKFVAEVKIKGQGSLLANFDFNAWSLASCPYANAKYCVAMPGVTFTEIANWGQCVPKLDSGVTSMLSGTASEGFEAISTLSVTEDAKKGVGDTIADIIKTWDVFLIVAILSLVVGLVVLVLMRFTLAPFVWISLFVVFLIFIGGGLAIVVRSNQCLNQGFVDAAQAQSGTAQATATNSATSAVNGTATVTNPFDVECAGGYSIQNKDARTAAKYCGYIVMGLGGVWALIVICMSCRIRLAIAINKCACMFLYNNPQVLLIPIIQNIIGIIWLLVWCYCAAFLLSTVGLEVVPTTTYATYAEAYGTADTAGKCTANYPPGDVYVDEFAPACANPGSDAAGPLCYKCSAPRFVFDWKFGYSFFSFLWSNFFIIALGQCTIAGAVGIWFFTAKGEKWKKATVLVSLKNALLWHSGSLAFGSLILAIVVWIKWFLTFLSKQAKQQKNKVMEMVFKCLAYLVWCFEKCVKFLNKNAYIQIALTGKNFCTSAKAAFWLIMRNALRFAVIAVLSHIVHVVAMVLICGLTAVLGYFILQQMYADVNPIAPTIIYAAIGWMTAKLFVGTFALAVDATLQCFIAAEEMDAGNDFAPEPLKAFINEKAESGEGSQSKGCDACCCTIM